MNLIARSQSKDCMMLQTLNPKPFRDEGLEL